MRKTSKIQIDIPLGAKIGGTCEDLCDYGVRPIDGAKCDRPKVSRHIKHIYRHLVECYEGQYYFVCDEAKRRIDSYMNDPRRAERNRPKWLRERELKSRVEREEIRAEEMRAYQERYKPLDRFVMALEASKTTAEAIKEKSPSFGIRADGSISIDAKNLELLKKIGFDVETVEAAIKKAKGITP